MVQLGSKLTKDITFNYTLIEISCNTQHSIVLLNDGHDPQRIIKETIKGLLVV